MLEVNDKVLNGESFAEMLDASEKRQESGIIEGTIVKIENDYAYVDAGRKTECKLNLDEITGEDGKLLFKEGDKISIVRKGEYFVSYKDAIVGQKVKDFIDSYDENAENKIEVKFTRINKRGDLTGYNAEGVRFIMPNRQCGNKDANKVLGKTLLVKIYKVNKEDQEILVSRRKVLDEQRALKDERLAAIKDNQDVIKGIVRKIMSYGMFVDVGGVDGLVHYSQISYKGPVNPTSTYKEGDEVSVKVIGFNEEKKQLSLSIKATLSDPWSEVEESLELGDQIQVTVSNIEEYGAFVDLGNEVEGFLHISEISWDKNTKDIRNYIKEGDVIDVEVIEIDREKRRLRVSLKNLLAKPFDSFKSTYKVGDIVKGTVVNLTDFGAFLSVSGVEGLLHNEDLNWEKSQKCKEVLKKGDVIEVKISKLDTDSGKISFSAKALTDGPVAIFAKTHKEGDIVKGTIEEIKDFGVFVKLGEGVDGLIRTEDLGNNAGELKIGDEIESAILFIDDLRNRVRLSIRRKERQAERNSLNEFNSRENNDEKNSLGDLIRGALK